MSDEGEKTCPLCAEEMDLTDQQLKPCKCGYEICVWCWHQIMDLAEKDESEGRCPACRTPYDKDKIVGMAANCERLVAEISMEKKHKSQKAKVKTSESRKQLTSVRVIQRNLVYIVGLPLNLADEDVLQRKEYFGQYGKVLKVSISRTSAGSIQQFANSTCSVYITYQKEDEAVRCIQSVHGFILDGRPLRACFGTTKYCHAWLRNAPCTNPDCLYLHEIGSQEDSFTKDEIISAYTRVQQITGVTNNLQRRSGNVLPLPPEDECNNSSTVIAKPIAKSSSNNSTSSTRVSPPNSSSGRSGALPPAASWGARVSNCNPPTVSLASSNGQTKQKAESDHGPPVVATILSGSIPINSSDGGKKQIISEETYTRQKTKSKSDNLDTMEHHSGINSQRNVSEMSTLLSNVPTGKPTIQSCSLASASDVEGSGLMSNTHSIDRWPCTPCEEQGSSSNLDVKSQILCSETSSISIDKQPNNEQHFDDVAPNELNSNNFLSLTSRDSHWHDSEKLQENLSSIAGNSTNGVDSMAVQKEDSDLRPDVESSSIRNLTSETEDDFNSQRLRDAIVVNQTNLPTSSPLHILSQLRVPLQIHTDVDNAVNYNTVNPPIVNRIVDEHLATNVASGSNGFLDHFGSYTLDQDRSLLSKGGHGNNHSEMRNNLDSKHPLDMGENSIISNILSLDLDPWDDSLTSPQNLAKLFHDTDKQEGSIKLAGSRKGQNSNQSRFSFARHEDSRNHLFDMEPSFGNIGQTLKTSSFGQDFLGNRDTYMERIGNGYGFSHRNIESSDNLISGQSIFPSSKLSVSRSQISPPPGFTAPSRPPPPGFSSHERSDQPFDVLKSGNHLVETSFLRNPYQASPSGNLSNTNDIEFFDPAILAVGEGRLPSGLNSSSLDMRSNFPVQTSAFENNSRLQALMQRSLSPHQNLRYNDVRDNFSPPNDVYGFTSRHMDQSQSSNHAPFSQFSLQQPRNGVVSNGPWDSWNELQVANDLLRSDRLGINKFYGGYEDAKFRMTNQGDLYNRSFGM